MVAIATITKSLAHLGEGEKIKKLKEVGGRVAGVLREVMDIPDPVPPETRALTTATPRAVEKVHYLPQPPYGQAYQNGQVTLYKPDGQQVLPARYVDPDERATEQATPAQMNEWARHSTPGLLWVYLKVFGLGFAGYVAFSLLLFSSLWLLAGVAALSVPVSFVLYQLLLLRERGKSPMELMHSAKRNQASREKGRARGFFFWPMMVGVLSLFIERIFDIIQQYGLLIGAGSILYKLFGR